MASTTIRSKLDHTYYKIHQTDALGSGSSKNQKRLEIKRIKITNDKWKDCTTINIDRKPDEISEILGTVLSNGGLISWMSAKIQMKPGNPQIAFETPPKGRGLPGTRNTDEHLIIIDATDSSAVEYELEVSVITVLALKSRVLSKRV
ncbi:hypothetical protein [Haladaptatus caseinilyticus]|uniref:hypothetical protein n=1 Tax=Haladaptatus caseinilyticus TaxID=2993314 RepID=UPI00224AA94C|nr:hypothetical protein [Haladaptatus caseinilyticus]